MLFVHLTSMANLESPVGGNHGAPVDTGVAHLKLNVEHLKTTHSCITCCVMLFCVVITIP